MTSKEKAERLYKRVNTFILTCVDSDGFPMTKAVVPGKNRKSIDEMFFCTNTSSKFANAIKKNSKASVYFYTRRLIWKGCYLRGTMEIVTDMEIKKKQWSNMYKNAYEEKAYTDPDFCVLQFKPIYGRFYRWYKIEDFEV